jgi:(1->4)-alpha-D-glucan 1-alpha-D-glucosylmutase
LRLVGGGDDQAGSDADAVQEIRGDGAGITQELYEELVGVVYPELRCKAEAGDDSARQALARLRALGERLGFAVIAPADAQADSAELADVLVRECLGRRRVPSTTYRLQFNRGFTFRDARDLVPYLHALGVSDCYASPVLQARAGSSHGYDVCDHSRLNPELGGEQCFEEFAAALAEHGLGLILDAVPNHMSIADPGNAWWMDVLEDGPGSPNAPFFDIDWRPVNPDLENKVLLPLLEDQYGLVLEAGKIRLAYEGGAFSLWYYQNRLPVAPCTYPAVLEPALPALAGVLGEGHDCLRELRSVLTALRYLPPRTDRSPDKVAERHREKEVIKRRLAALCAASPEVRAAIDASVRTFNGTVGDPRSFNLLDALLESQAYRLAYWRVAAEEINYRRFFDINELAAIRMELPDVFRATHETLVRLLAEGKATGLRIDHPDGLRDPAGYFRQLQQAYVLARADLEPGRQLDGLAREVAARLPGSGSGDGPAAWPLYVVAEKILSKGESLPPDWAVDGTTGYDFLNAVNGLFVDREGRDAFDQIYHSFTGAGAGYGQLVSSAKRMTMLVSMVSEINALAHQLDRIAERNRRCRDFTLNSLTFALREIIACLPVYRTYITGPEGIAAQDRRVVEAAVDEAKRRNPRTAEAVFDFVRDAVLLSSLQDFPEADRPRLVEWALKFQQLTGPIMAKSVEDTVFYSYNRLVSLNEVGGSPEQYGVSVAAFHRQNAERLERWPHSLLTTSTHDTKRSEDVRARLNALSELPGEWQAAVTRWGRINSSKKAVVEDQPAPDRNDEYLLYQTLLGAWPAQPPTAEGLADFRGRIAEYMQKATKEAKVHTSWVNPNEEYDDAVRQFIARLLPEAGGDPFLDDLLPLQRRLAFFGSFNSLAQVLLKLTCPGVPDLYQGTELWDFSLVDPDNRRPVDYRRRREVLAELQERVAEAAKDLTPLTDELLANLPDGRIKAYLIYQTLQFRRAHSDLFAHGAYLPLEATGARRDHVCAFARVAADAAELAIVVVPRLVARLSGGTDRPPLGPEVWGKTRLLLPAPLAGQSYQNILTGEVLQPDSYQGTPGLLLEWVLARFPVALLRVCGMETQGRVSSADSRAQPGSAPHLVAQNSHASTKVNWEVRKDTTCSFGESFGQPAPRSCQSPTASFWGIHSLAISWAADSLGDGFLSAAVRAAIPNQQTPASTSPSTSRVYRPMDEPSEERRANGGPKS